MNGKCFVDTNILVYARDAGEGAKHQRARALVHELWSSRTGRLSVQVLNEYFVTVTHKLKPGLTPEAAWADIETFRAWEPVPMDFPLLERSHKLFSRHALSRWDSFIVAAAEVSGSETLYSEDLQDGATYGGVTVRNPFAF